MSSTSPLSSQGRLDAAISAAAVSAGRKSSSDDVATLFSASCGSGAALEKFHPPMSFLRRGISAPTATRSRYEDRDQRKETERKELLEMILESIANVPKAVEKIHTNEKLRQALHQQMGEENSLLHRIFDGKQQEGRSLLVDKSLHWNRDAEDRPLVFDSYRQEEESRESEDSSSDYGAEYENDLAEAVNQLCMTDDTLTAMDDMISDPIGIVQASLGGTSSAKISNSPPSSFGLGASPGATSMDGEPVSALWPRQPNQFAFTQEEDNNVRAEDEVYSEMVSSVCEDDNDTFQDDVDGDDENGDADSPGNVTQEKLFEMDDDDEEDNEGTLENDLAHFSGGGELENDLAHFANEGELDNDMTHFISEDTVPGEFVVGSPIQGQVTTFQNDLDGKSKQKIDTVHTVDIKKGEDVCDDDEGSEDSHDDDDDEPKEYEVFQLRMIREKNRTGFEPNQDWRPRAGTLIGNRYKVEMAIGEAVFSRTYKCIDTTSEQTVCLKIIKNNKEYFDQGVDEIRVLEYIDENCKVDEKHLVRYMEAFYFREHLIIVTELLRDNLYEFSRLLLQRGVINYFSIPRLKKITIEVLEALDTLHSLGLVHCDLKPENILIQNFSACTIKVIDFGSACFTTDELTSYVQSRSYRAPEVVLGLMYDTKIDMWSLGCVLAEMFTGEVLFRNDSEQTLLARILATIGPIPASLLAEREDLQHQLIDTGLFTVDHLGNGVLVAQLHVPTLEQAVPTKDPEFLDFLRALLQIDPVIRLSAQEALTHPWLQHVTIIQRLSGEFERPSDYPHSRKRARQMTPLGDDVSSSQEMQNQVETLHLDTAALSPERTDQKRLDSTILPSSGSDNQERHVSSDGVTFYTSDQWAKFYPNQEVAVVTSIGQPPIPPEGYVPLRNGHRRQQSLETSEEDVPNGFSLDTLLWGEKLLEQRIMQLTAWTRRSPMPRRQKLDRINRMVN